MYLSQSIGIGPNNVLGFHNKACQKFKMWPFGHLEAASHVDKLHWLSNGVVYVFFVMLDCY